MAYLRIYRDFYCIQSEPTVGSDIYTLINVVSISSIVKILGSGTDVESPVVIKESIGKYYVELDPGLYNIDDTYEINWLVKYTNNSPEKTLITRFKFKPIVIGQNVDIRLNTEEIRLEIVNS
jgi:hypothetical protein|tara:strand:+ start:111 stop:476 length:366 start_codon:yes stop_codon:yes gene_type:complete